jgi:hypothetical protein
VELLLADDTAIDAEDLAAILVKLRRPFGERVEVGAVRQAFVDALT